MKVQGGGGDTRPTATKFGATGWSRSNTGTKHVEGIKREKEEESEKHKEEKKRSNGRKKKTPKNHKMSSGRIDLVAFQEGLRARPLDHRKFLIRSICWNTVRQSSYIPSALKIVLDVLAIFYVVQILLLYYPRSTNPRCAVFNFLRNTCTFW